MEKRLLGNSDLELSLIGLGTWAIGGEWEYGWGPQDDNDSVATIIEALDAGINWIDTAPAYGIGHSEVIVGKAIKEWKNRGGQQPIIATKCGLVGKPDRTVDSCLKRDSIIKECEESLRRLDIDQIDLYQIHWPDPAGDIGEGFQTLLDLQQQGKIRWAGVSNFSRPQLEHIVQYGMVASLQPPYSMIDRGIEESILPWCANHSVGVIPYSPLQAGMLTGKVTREWINNLPHGDWRKTKSDFYREPRLSRSLSFVERIKKMPLAKEHALAEIAIQWILKRRGVTAAICGARKPGQISQLVKALTWQITADEIAVIDRIFNEEFEQ